MGDEQIRAAQDRLAAAPGKPYRWGGTGMGVDADRMSATIAAFLRGERTPPPPPPLRRRVLERLLRPAVPVLWWIAETATDAARRIEWARPSTGRIAVRTTTEFPWGGFRSTERTDGTSEGG